MLDQHLSGQGDRPQTPKMSADGTTVQTCEPFPLNPARHHPAAPAFWETYHP